MIHLILTHGGVKVFINLWLIQIYFRNPKTVLALRVPMSTLFKSTKNLGLQSYWYFVYDCSRGTFAWNQYDYKSSRLFAWDLGHGPNEFEIEFSILDVTRALKV